METFTVPGAADGVRLSTLVIAPESPKAVLQLVHGMAEHKERYIPFMNYLSEMGYACGWARAACRPWWTMSTA